MNYGKVVCPKRHPFLAQDLGTRVQPPFDPVSWRPVCRMQPVQPDTAGLAGPFDCCYFVGLLGTLLVPKAYLSPWSILAFIFSFFLRQAFSPVESPGLYFVSFDS